MDRRTFLAGTSAVLLAAPLATETQQKPVPRSRLLSSFAKSCASAGTISHAKGVSSSHGQEKLSD